MVKAMIFDLDGTLVQTEKLKALSYARAAVQLCTREKVTIVILGLVFLSLLVIFSFRYPWFDVFAIPPGWE